MSYPFGMKNLEETTAETLVAYASDVVSTYYGEEDWDAGIAAVLARALEISTGRTLKPLEELWMTSTHNL